MKIKVFTVHDIKAGAYMQPFHMQTVPLAIRAFAELSNDKNHQFGRYPEDYQLFEIGEYDDATANYTMLPSKVPLGSALEHQKITQHITQEQNILSLINPN